MVMMKRVVALCLSVLMIINLAPVALACGPSYIIPVYVMDGSPDPPFGDFTRGNIGIVQPGFGRKTMVIAYRYLTGGSFNADEQAALIEALHGILSNEDRDAAQVVEQQMMKDGVKLLCCGRDLHIVQTADGKKLSVQSHGQQYDVTVDEILVAAGRTPNVEGLGLEEAGVQFDRRGVQVNGRLQTTNPKIFAAGDVCSPYKYTHAADAMAQIVVQNALFPHPFSLGYASIDSLIMPWCTFTDPEIAHVGLYEKDAEAKGIGVETYTFKLEEVDRSILDDQEEGFARVHILCKNPIVLIVGQ